ncbi:MAG: DUF4038 domain-containing protein, partial [Anaerolineales bacterium]|nr:DUF4038 domain-containing protein [Anaerolineales bacterium]
PFNEVTLDAVFTGPDGVEQTVPAFWSGGQTWRVRFAARQPGSYRLRTICSDASNRDLHSRQETVEAVPYCGSNPLLAHGFPRVAPDQRHLEYADGAPFFWMADTWWMGLVKRLPWPGGFQELAADRVAKGFTVIQIVAGLYPDMGPFDERGANEAGFPWKQDFSCINPDYFEMADARLGHLVRSGLMPCIVGQWGYFMDFAGLDVLKKHWRNIIARYGAYPVAWCTAGEAMMPYYLVENFPHESEEATARKRAGWTELVRTIREIDSYRHPVTIAFGLDQVDDISLLDMYMIGGSHSGYSGLAAPADNLLKGLEQEPRRPCYIGETHYEGISESCREEMQRFVFWSCMLSGAMGHTYGANGIWQVNSREAPFGPSPHGSAWGNLPWEDAYRLPGSEQLGISKRLLEQFPWWRLESHPEWVEPHNTPEDRLAPYAAGVPGEWRLVYLPPMSSRLARQGQLALAALEPGRSYRTRLFDPKTGDSRDLGTVSGDAEGRWRVPTLPVFQDFVLILES